MILMCSKKAYSLSKKHLPAISYISSIKFIIALDNSHNYDYNICMRRKMVAFLCLSSFAALVLGAIIYVLFRGQTVFTALLERFGIAAGVFSDVQIPFGAFIRYYLPDYLWCYAFCCQAVALFELLRIKTLGAYFMSAIFGAAWEALQWLGFVSGTGDLADCAMYLAAVATVVVIENHFKKRSRLK